MTTWLIRKSGSDNNGGTSATIRSSGADAISDSTAGLTLLSSLTAGWTAGDVGHGVTVANRNRVITAVTPATSKTVTTTNTSQNVTSAAQFDVSMVGQAVSGPGVPAGTCVRTFTDASHITLSQAAGAGAGTGTMTFGVKLTTTGGTAFSAGTALSYIVGGAFLTIAEVINVTASGVVAGDTIYLGAGTYREAMTWNRGGSAGSPLTFIGDDGTITGDVGEVVVTNYLDDLKSPGTVACNFQAFGFITWRNVSFYTGGSGVPFQNASGSTDIGFIDCTIVQCGSATMLQYNSAGGVPLNFLFDRCWMYGLRGITMFDFEIAGTGTSATYPTDVNILFRNSFMFNASNGNVITTNANGTLAQNRSGGLRVIGCTIIGSVCLSLLGTWSIDLQCEVRNSLLISGANNPINLGTAFTCIEENNFSFGNAPGASVRPGKNSVMGIGQSALGIELGSSYRLNGIARQLFGPASLASILVGFRPRVVGGSPNANLRELGEVPPGSPLWHPPGLRLDQQQDYIPTVPPLTVDIFNRQRPSGSNLPGCGAFEFHDIAAADAVLFDVGPQSAKFTGPGDQEFLVPVDATSQTLSIRCYVGQTYSGGPLPTVTLLPNVEIGVASQVVSAVAGAGVWQTITLGAFTPTAAGFVKLRLSSYDSGAGQVNFDTFAVA